MAYEDGSREIFDSLQPQDDAHLHEDYEPDISNLTDRELLEYIAGNMLTPDRVVTVITERLPEILATLESSPLIRTLLKFI